MGVITPNGPNPFETDVNDPRYTALSQFKNNWMQAGLPSDALTFMGKGSELEMLEKDMHKDVSVGDIAVLGNRVGFITAVVKNGGTGLVETITVKEDLRYLPTDYRSAPATFGYDNSNTDTGRTITYIMRSGLTVAGIRNGNVDQACTLGTLLVFKARTSDPLTWPRVTQSARLFQATFGPQPVTVVVEPEEETVEPDNTVQFTASILPAEAFQEVTWSIEVEAGLTIDSDGLVTVGALVPDGDYTVTATSVIGGITGTAVLTIDDGV